MPTDDTRALSPFLTFAAWAETEAAKHCRPSFGTANVDTMARHARLLAQIEQWIREQWPHDSMSCSWRDDDQLDNWNQGVYDAKAHIKALLEQP